MPKASKRKPHKRGMTDRAWTFCHEYIRLGVGEKAAIAAGYSPKSAMTHAWRLLRNEKVKEKITELRARHHAKLELSTERILQEYMRLAFTKITDVVDLQKGQPFLKNMEVVDKNALSAIQAISQTAYGVKIKMHDKKGALDSLAKHLGLFTEDNKREIEMKVGNITEEDAKIVKKLFDDITE